MITLITVTYNASKTLERTLLSVMNQSYTDIQHIIMDGGSNDDTMDIAQDYRQKAEAKGIEVIIVSERDKGLYDAMNKAIDLADGDFICFLNAGDKLHSDSTLMQVAEVAIPDHVGIIYGDTDIVDDNGNKIRSRRLSPPENLTSQSFKSGMLVCHQSFYANRDVVQKYKLKYRFSADFDWCIRCMQKAEDYELQNKNLHIVLTDYLNEGMTTANHKASLIERFRIMAVHYGWFTTLKMHLWFVVRGIIKK